jgi:hypothetical protein
MLPCWILRPITTTAGCASIGQIDAVGPAVVQAAVGDKVAAYLAVGGYAEYIYLREDKIIPVPSSVNPAAAVTLVLNYLVAYQVMHRSAKTKAGDKVLIAGASGGCGTAFLDPPRDQRPVSTSRGSTGKRNTRKWPGRRKSCTGCAGVAGGESFDACRPLADKLIRGVEFDEDESRAPGEFTNQA